MSDRVDPASYPAYHVWGGWQDSSFGAEPMKTEDAYCPLVAPCSDKGGYAPQQGTWPSEQCGPHDMMPHDNLDGGASAGGGVPANVKRSAGRPRKAEDTSDDPKLARRRAQNRKAQKNTREKRRAIAVTKDHMIGSLREHNAALTTERDGCLQTIDMLRRELFMCRDVIAAKESEAVHFSVPNSASPGARLRATSVGSDESTYEEAPLPHGSDLSKLSRTSLERRIVAQDLDISAQEISFNNKVAECRAYSRRCSLNERLVSKLRAQLQQRPNPLAS